MPAFSDKLTDYYREARLRARRRKSLWNVLLLGVGFIAWLAVWYALFSLVWAFHAAVYPEHRFADFWPRGVSTKSFALSFLMMFAIAPGAMALGFMTANVLAWPIPLLRHTFDAEAKGYPGTDFRSSMRGLISFAVWTLPIGLAVALVAAALLRSLR
jgi:hypothetical protein